MDNMDNRIIDNDKDRLTDSQPDQQNFSETKEQDLTGSDQEVKKKNYDREKELFMKGFKIGKRAGLVAVTITGLTSGVGILKTVAKKILRG